MGRLVTLHEIDGCPHSGLSIRVADEPSSGTASHHYTIVKTISDGRGGFGVVSLSHILANLIFQEGPVPLHGVNGVTHEALLAIVADRLACYQAGALSCRENETALFHVEMALEALKGRTRDRVARGVEGTMGA